MEYAAYSLRGLTYTLYRILNDPSMVAVYGKGHPASGESTATSNQLKCVYGLKNKTYQQRLKILGILSLEMRRTRGDLIETYKILTGKEDIDKNQLFQLSSNIHSTRGHH